MRMRCPDFPWLRCLSVPGLPMLNGELIAKCQFIVWLSWWGIEVEEME